MSATPSAANAKVLVIDDDKDLRYSLRRALAGLGHTVIEADSGETGVVAAKREQPDVILLDNRMGGMTGIETLQMLRGAQPQAMVILMTAFGTTQTAIEAMKFGAYDYVMKPFDQAKLITLVDKALSARRDLAAATKSTRTLVNPADYKEGIVGSSEPMQEVLKSIGQVAASDATVLITGESGTGKELVARCIHQHSLRAKGTFLAVNCAAIPENLIESELFGHEKGAFTGATNQKLGKFELCDGGTIFLDEIGDMALATQTKILRVLQAGEIQRVGGTETIRVDVRILAATNKDLEEMVKAKTFREDLYYRLNVVRIRMPPLRERAEDIPSIVDFCLQNLVKQRKARVSKVSPEALAILTKHRWPGNVRELENVVYRSAVIAQGDAILVKNLPAELLAAVGEDPAQAVEAPPAVTSTPSTPFAAPAQPAAAFQALDAALDYVLAQLREADEPVMKRLEREMISRVMKAEGGDVTKAAKRLGLTKVALAKKLAEPAV